MLLAMAAALLMSQVAAGRLLGGDMVSADGRTVRVDRALLHHTMQHYCNCHRTMHGASCNCCSMQLHATAQCGMKMLSPLRYFRLPLLACCIACDYM